MTWPRQPFAMSAVLRSLVQNDRLTPGLRITGAGFDDILVRFYNGLGEVTVNIMSHMGT